MVKENWCLIFQIQMSYILQLVLKSFSKDNFKMVCLFQDTSNFFAKLFTSATSTQKIISITEQVGFQKQMIYIIRASG